MHSSPVGFFPGVRQLDGEEGCDILAQQLLFYVCRCLVIGLMQKQKTECLPPKTVKACGKTFVS